MYLCLLEFSGWLLGAAGDNMQTLETLCSFVLCLPPLGCDGCDGGVTGDRIMLAPAAAGGLG